MAGADGDDSIAAFARIRGILQQVEDDLLDLVEYFSSPWYFYDPEKAYTFP
jgi:hypothetical protein